MKRSFHLGNQGSILGGYSICSGHWVEIKYPEMKDSLGTGNSISKDKAMGNYQVSLGN